MRQLRYQVILPSENQWKMQETETIDTINIHSPMSEPWCILPFLLVYEITKYTFQNNNSSKIIYYILKLISYIQTGLHQKTMKIDSYINVTHKVHYLQWINDHSRIALINSDSFTHIALLDHSIIPKPHRRTEWTGSFVETLCLFFFRIMTVKFQNNSVIMLL